MRFGICSEIFEAWHDIERTIEYVKEVGYDGLEIAPFTLSQYVTDIPDTVRKTIVKKARAVDLDIIGLHWLLVGPENVHLTHPDESIRERTAQYLIDLTNFCGDVGGSIMVFGSPKQRNLEEGVSFEDAMNHAVSVFEKALPVCEKHGVTICMEPLSPKETNFCQTVEETVQLIERIDHPHFRLLLDTKAMAAEELDRPELIRTYADLLAHYHANDENLKGPGFGDVDFAPIFATLNEIGFGGYVSVEVFNFDDGPEAIATRSLEYMKSCLAGAA